MKLIESKAEYIPQEEGLEGIYKQIEKCGRTCYKSENKITEDSAKNFVDRMIKSNHTAMLEHGTVYLAIPYTNEETLSHYRGMAGKYNEIEFTRYSKVTMMRGAHNYVATNYRVLVENNWLDDLQYLCNPTKFHEKRYTFKFTTDRGVSHQLVRERAMSPAQESQRYCNYLKEKFGMSVTFIQPSWVLEEDQAELEEDIKQVEFLYFKWLNKGYKPEEARYFLINGTKTEICITGFASDFRHMLDLRLFEKTGKVSPDMLDLMQKAQKAIQEAGIWEDIMSKPSKFE